MVSAIEGLPIVFNVILCYSSHYQPKSEFIQVTSCLPTDIQAASIEQFDTACRGLHIVRKWVKILPHLLDETFILVRSIPLIASLIASSKFLSLAFGVPVSGEPVLAGAPGNDAHLTIPFAVSTK
jgi:hypothetical protein